MPENESQNQKHVHIVDDDSAVLDSMRALLESQGYKVSACSNPEDFLDRALKGGNGFAKGCLLLDLHMDAMNGVDLIEKLRAHHIDIPVIVITGDSTPAEKARAEALGAHAVFDKPIDSDVLFQTLDAALI